MSCSQTVQYPCALAAAEYWALKNEAEWAAHQDEEEGNTRTVLLDKLDADGTRTTRARVTAKENPIPKALRSLLGAGESFSFTVTESWLSDRWDEASAAIFQTEPAVCASKIKVGGAHWVEEAGPNECVLCFRLDVDVRVVGIGSKLAKGILAGTVASYAAIPERALRYLAARRDAAVVAGAAPPRPTLSKGGALAGTSKALADAVVCLLYTSPSPRDS